MDTAELDTAAGCAGTLNGLSASRAPLATPEVDLSGAESGAGKGSEGEHHGGELHVDRFVGLLRLLLRAQSWISFLSVFQIDE